MPPITLNELTEDTDPVVAPALSPAQGNRFAAEILRALRHGTNRQFLRTASVAPAVRTPVLETALAWCAKSCEPAVARRARYVLRLIASA
jgi:hypothetical protein